MKWKRFNKFWLFAHEKYVIKMDEKVRHLRNFHQLAICIENSIDNWRKKTFFFFNFRTININQITESPAREKSEIAAIVNWQAFDNRYISYTGIITIIIIDLMIHTSCR